MNKYLVIAIILVSTITTTIIVYSLSNKNPHHKGALKPDESMSPDDSSSTSNERFTVATIDSDETPVEIVDLEIPEPENSNNLIQSIKDFITKPDPVFQQEFVETFDREFVVTEAGTMAESEDQNWWLSSGAYLYSNQSSGHTILGDLPELDSMRLMYDQSNPTDTSGGYRPQNIFRFVLKSKWNNFQQQAYFKILSENFIDSPYRNGSNGLLFFNRYQDSNNLYYTGIRVDGLVTIKKKQLGNYTTLSQKKVLPGTYDRNDNPNLLPKETWIGLRSVVTTDSANTVHIKVYIDVGKTGKWQLMLEASDYGKGPGEAFLKEGFAGIRTDFMDVQFDDYQIKSL